MSEKNWADVKIGLRRTTHRRLKDLKYDLKVDTFDQAVEKLIDFYGENKKNEVI
jgi:hypothetical protein